MRQILKLQRSLVTSEQSRQMLAYNKDRSFSQQEPYPPEADILFGGEDKVFVDAEVKDTDITVFGKVADPGW